MSIDEFYFHENRKLPSWEKMGHPLDTLTTFLTLLIPVLFEPSEVKVNIYLTLAIFSCIFITKDEFIHSNLCSKTEHWLHSMLFILHPIMFVATYLIWIQAQDSDFLIIQLMAVGVFMGYQIIRWNIYER